jgi:hypothetical protein
MKKNAFIAFCAVAFLMASCGAEESTDSSDESGEKQEQEEMVEKEVGYGMDIDKSSLKWKGFEGEDEFHVGTIAFSEGSLVMNGDAVEEGSFTVDMSSIAVTDEGMPEKYKEKLQGHLGAEDVWNIAQFASTTVTLGEYKDGKLNITLNVLGKEVPAAVPVSISVENQVATIQGEFKVDFSSLGVPLFEPQEEEDESISPVIDFSLLAVLAEKEKKNKEPTSAVNHQSSKAINPT